jgi:LysM repeat protein/soluble lytic murein transglycosylase-like protein
MDLPRIFAMYDQCANAPTLTLPFAKRKLPLALALLLTGVLAGCSSTPHKPQTALDAAKTAKKTSTSHKKTPPQGKTYGTGQLSASSLDTDSLDALEALLEATDMAAVEGNKMAVMRHGDVWQRMRAGFKMDLEFENSRIAAQRNWFATRQTYLDRLTARASRYLYHTVSEAEKRGIPTELALLPVIESSYDPAATSNAAAAGLWQFIPSTGRLYGLRQNELYDGRRDVVESTRAAYDFLTSLYNKFGSWELALASYNAGPGRIQQAINRNAAQGLPTDFWSLRLPQETMNYVPRFLAVAQIVNQPERYGVRFNPIANRPHFRQVPLPGPIDLSLAAQVTGLSGKELYELNPAFRRGQTDPEGPHRLLIPNHLSAHVDEQISKLPTIDGIRTPSGAWLANNSSPAGTVVLNQSRGYTTAQAAALMGDASRNSTGNLSSQITARSNSNPTTSRPRLPTDSAGLAALASQGLTPSSVPRLAMPNSGSSSSARNNVEPPLSAAERQRVMATSTTAEPPISANEKQLIVATVAPPAMSAATPAEPPLSVEERQRLMRSITTTAAIQPSPVVASPAVFQRTPVNDPLLTATEKAQVVAEIQAVAPNTTVVDPLDGKIELTAIQTQQSVLSATGQERQVRYEQPYLATEKAPSRTANLTASKPAAVTPPPVVVNKPKPKGERTIYTVQAGDTLTGLARRFSVNINDVADWNQIERNANLIAGTQLYLYGLKTDTRPTSYTVQAGDTLTAVAAKFGLSNQQLADYNGLSATSNLIAGVRLSLVDTPTAKAARNKPAQPTTESYTVKAGDSLIGLATRFGVEPEELAKLNNTSSSRLLQVGETLVVPVQDGMIAQAESRSSRNRAPETEDYVVKKGDSLKSVAARFDMSVDELAKLNDIPAQAKIRAGDSMKVPAQAESAKGSRNRAPDTDDYVVKKGDSLKSVAARFDISIDALAKLNDIPAQAKIRAGDSMKVPVQAEQAKGKSKRQAEPELTEYTVKRGDSWNSLANKLDITGDELAKLNGMSANRMLQLGETIKLPADANLNRASTQAKADSKDKKRSKTATTSYTIKRGDTLNSIARKFEVDINELAGMNGIPANTLVRVGDSIEVPELAPKTVDYVVRRGDTLARVANKHGVTLAQLAELNEIPTDAKLQAGDTLSVPNQKNGTDR